MPRWVNAIFSALLAGPFVFVALFAFESPFLFVVMLQVIFFVGIYVAEWRRPDHDMHLGLNVLVLALFLVTAGVYWVLGGEEPGIFALVSVVPAVLSVLRLLLAKPRALEETPKTDA